MYIQMQKVVKKYGEGENTIFALNHADLELEQGEICVVLGPSGSGKVLCSICWAVLTALTRA